MVEVSGFAVMVAAVLSFVFGALWYSPIMFLKPWAKTTGVNLEKSIENPAVTYSITFMATFLTAFAFALVLGTNPDWQHAITLALVVGIGFVASSMGINYQFAQASLQHWLIDSGFHVGRFLIMAAVFAYMGQ